MRIILLDEVDFKREIPVRPLDVAYWQIPRTGAGVEWFGRGMPSWPYSLRPQHRSPPVIINAQV
jgi:hypothetical protein